MGKDDLRRLYRRRDSMSRRLMHSVREAALEFARRQVDDEFLAAIERLTDV